MSKLLYMLSVLILALGIVVGFYALFVYVIVKIIKAAWL